MALAGVVAVKREPAIGGRVQQIVRIDALGVQPAPENDCQSETRRERACCSLFQA